MEDTRITEITPLPGLKLKARFTNGEYRLYDVSRLKEKWPPFEALDYIGGLFELVRIDCGGWGIVWNDDIDLASEEIWYNGVEL